MIASSVISVMVASPSRPFDVHFQPAKLFLIFGLAPDAQHNEDSRRDHRKRHSADDNRFGDWKRPDALEHVYSIL